MGRHIEHLLTNAETYFLGETWAMADSTFFERLWWAMTTCLWPGVYDKEVTQLIIQADVGGEPSIECARLKQAAASAIGLDIKL